MRAGSRAALGLALTSVVIVGTVLSAHRLDEYLQAARLGIEPGRLELELDLTPGVAVAAAIIAEIDRDRDGWLSADEKRAYVGHVLGAIELQLDGQTLHAKPITSTFPVVDSFRHGDGTIRLQLDAALPRLSEGSHQLFFRNTHRPEMSAYLANALVPDSDRIVVTAQSRDGRQQDLTIDFLVRPPVKSAHGWLLGGIAGAALLALMARPSKGGISFASHESSRDAKSGSVKSPDR